MKALSLAWSMRLPLTCWNGRAACTASSRRYQSPRASSASQPKQCGTWGHFCMAALTISSIVSLQVIEGASALTLPTHPVHHSVGQGVHMAWKAPTGKADMPAVRRLPQRDEAPGLAGLRHAVEGHEGVVAGMDHQRREAPAG